MNNEYIQEFGELTPADLALVAATGFWGCVGTGTVAAALVGGGYGLFFGPDVIFGAAAGAIAGSIAGAISYAVGKFLG